MLDAINFVVILFIHLLLGILLFFWTDLIGAAKANNLAGQKSCRIVETSVSKGID